MLIVVAVFAILWMITVTIILFHIASLQEKLMATQGQGLADLELFTGTTFPAFITQFATDMGTLSANQTSLTAAIDAAIAALEASGSSEDPQVEAAVAQLKGALVTATSNDASLQSINGNLSKLATSLSAVVPSGSSSISGSVTSGVFVAGEKVLQGVTGAFGVLAGAPPSGGPMILTLDPTSPVPDATDLWTGQTSGAVFTPSGAPVQVNPAQQQPAVKGVVQPAVKKVS